MSPSSILTGAASLLQASSQQLEHVVRLECEGSCLRSWKIGFSAILLVEGLLFAHLVYFLKRFTAGPKFHAAIRIGNALAAGIFLATGLLHIFPEAVEFLGGGEGHEEHARMLGVAVRVLSKLVRDEDDHDHEEGEEHGEEHGEEEHGEHGFPWAFLLAGIAFYFLFFMEKIVLPKLFPSLASHEIHAKDVEEQSEKTEEPSETQGFTSGAFVEGLMQVVGISLHSLFESMALGVSSSFDVMLNIFIATASHRWATSTALAFRFIRTLSYLPFLVLMTLFSSAVPIGVAIGAALSDLSTTVQGVLFALSAGTFLYLGAFELMAEEFVEHRDWKLRKFMLTLLGAGIITVITIVLNATGVHG